MPPPAEGRSSPTNTPVFPPSSFVLLSFVGSTWKLRIFSHMVPTVQGHAHLISFENVPQTPLVPSIAAVAESLSCV